MTNCGKSGRNADGTFAAGNSGKPRGTRNRTTRAIQSLLDGEADALTRKAIALALNGDVTALRLCMDRLAPPPKDQPVQFDLPPLTSAEDAVRAAGSVLEAVSTGDLTPSEGAQIMGLVEAYRRALETSELEVRLRALEGVDGWGQ